MDPASLLAAAQKFRSRPRGATLETYLDQDAKLVAAGFPPTSPWWIDALGPVLGPTTQRALVARVGRRGGKSSTACRFAVNEVLRGSFQVPPGDTGWFSFLSITKEEAMDRFHTIKTILSALRVPFEASGSRLRVSVGGQARGFRVYAASSRTAVGGTWIGASFDELAKWEDEKTGKNPATQILGATRPAMMTQPNARELLISSPWSTIDAHYDAFQLGTTAGQHVAEAPTWVANPTLTEAACRLREPDEETFLREYGARPMSSLSTQFFDAEAIRGACSPYDLPLLRAEPGDVLTAGADFAFRSDSSAVVVTRRTGAVYRVVDMLELSPRNGVALVPSDVVASVAGRVVQHGVTAIMADAHYRESILEHLHQHDCALLDAPLDVPATYVRARSLLHQGHVKLPQRKGLTRDLMEVTATPTATGRITIKLPKRQGGGHCDTVSALVLALWQKQGHLIEPLEEVSAHWTPGELAELQRDRDKHAQDNEEWGIVDEVEDEEWF